MSEAEIAVIAVSRTLFELLIANKVLTAEAVDNLLAIQQQGFEKQNLLAAAGILGTVRTLLTKTHPVQGGKH